jgi:hypothetical protein
MKPSDINLQEGKEVVIKLNTTPYVNTVGCPHEWRQTSITQAECIKCGLGVWGKVSESGTLT